FSGGLPERVPRAAIAARSVGRQVHYVVGGSKQTLLDMVNLGCIAVHVMSCRVGSLDDADWLAFDLDPSSGQFADAARAGRVLHRTLGELGVRGFPKTSGGRGLHVFVPLAAGQRFDDVRAFARAVAALMVERQPELVTLTFAKRERGERVFVDTLRNSFG